MMTSSKLKKIVVLLAVLVIAMSTTSAGRASVQTAGEASPAQAGGTVLINIWDPDPVIVGAGQKAKVTFWWGACSKGLVTDAVKSIRATYVLKKSNGKIIETHKTKPSKWGGYQPDGPYECVWPSDSQWAKMYKSPALTLAKPGTYYLEVLTWFKTPVIDGTDFDSDWPVDYYPAGTFIDRTITITKN